MNDDPRVSAVTPQSTIRAGSRRRFKHRLFLFTIYIAWIALLCWGGLKLFWWWQFGVSPQSKPDENVVWQFYYPELRLTHASDAPLGPDDGFYDVVLFGGSVLEQAGPEFERALKEILPQQWRLYNLARAAHTSRDTYLKNSRIGNRPFDLVIVYHGINDARMNCCPDEAFREDYTHFRWYGSFRDRRATGRLSIPDILVAEVDHAKDFVMDVRASAHYGVHVKTANAFRRNIESIVESAEMRKCPVVLMTFAYDIPPNYSAESFRAKRLDYHYTFHSAEVALWGTAEGVRAAIDTHNRMIREIVARHPSVTFVDQKQRIPADGVHFTDVCHLTDQGNREFVGHILSAVKVDVERWKAAHGSH